MHPALGVSLAQLSHRAAARKALVRSTRNRSERKRLRFALTVVVVVAGPSETMKSKHEASESVFRDMKEGVCEVACKQARGCASRIGSRLKVSFIFVCLLESETCLG